MAKRNTGRHGRSRKRRPATPSAAPQGSGEAGRAGADGSVTRTSSPAPRRERARARPRGAAERGGDGYRDPLSVGERPQAPWHPLPLSELLILVGAIGTVFGLRRGLRGGPALFAGIGAVALGTIEVTLREHLSGYRSHTILLALLPIIVFHSAVILLLAAVTQVPRLLNVVLLLIDGALFAFLFKLLRARFLDARRERTFAGRR